MSLTDPLPRRARALRAAACLLLLAGLPRSAAALENFDGVGAPALPAGWSTEAIVNGAPGAGPLWHTVTDSAHSAPNAAYVLSDAFLGRLSLISPAFTVQAGQRLRFRHRYRLDGEPAGLRDGGVLEIAIPGVNGGNFTDVLTAGGQFLAGGYVQPINAAGNPLSGRLAWGGQQAAFVTTEVQLPAAAAGQSIRLRWSVGTDNIGTAADSGWWIDTVSLIADTTFPPGENFDLMSGGELPSGWSTQSSGPDADWRTVADASHTAPNAAFIPEASNVADKSLVSPAFTPVMGQVLRFRHRHELFSSFDGAVLEFSVAGGPYEDITAGGVFRSGGYGSQVIPGSGNPLGLRSAWTANSNGFIETLVRLPDATAGQSTRLRWRLGSDSFEGLAVGWWVDSIALEAPRTVTANATGAGQISPAGASSVEYGQTTTFTVTANAGSHLDSIASSCGGSLIDLDTFRTGEVRADCTVTANFVAGASDFPDTEDFDGATAPALPGGWFTQTSGPGPAWTTVNQFADSAPNQAYVPASGNTDKSLISPEFTLAAGHVLSFRHHYSGFAVNQTGYDGGVLEIAIGSGGYTDILAAGGTFLSEGYVRTMSNSTALAGRQAWSGNSGGYVTSRVRLPEAAGQRARLRWRIATLTNGNSGFGWRVDTIALSTPAPVSATPSVIGNGTVTPPDSITRPYGEVAEFEVHAAPHHHLDHVDGSCGGAMLDAVRFRTAPLFADCSVVVHFVADPPDFPLAEDFDNDIPGELPWGWSTQSSGAGADWTTVNDAAHTPANAAYVPAHNDTGDKALVSPAFTPVPGQVLRFWHRYRMPNFPASLSASSGGVLEMSIDGGAFQPIETLGGVFLAGGYGHLVLVPGQHPLQQRWVWSGDSGGFVETEVRLPQDAAGHAVRLRWRVATVNDAFGGDGGWWLDSIQLHVPPPPVVVGLAQGPGVVFPQAPIFPTYGDTASVELTPDIGAHLTGVASDCGGSLTAIDVFTTGRVRAPCTLTAQFQAGTPLFPPMEDFDSAAAPALPFGWLALSSDELPGWHTEAGESPSQPNLARLPLTLSINDKSLVSPPFVPVAGQRLRFAQHHELPEFDATQAVGGAVLEIAIDGADFVDILEAGGEFLAGGYTHTMITGAPVLPARSVWSDRSAGFFDTTVRLPDEAIGKSTRLRWRVGSVLLGFIGTDRGWFLDDIGLETPAPHLVIPSATGAGTIAPDTPVVVEYGETATFDLDADPGHAVGDVESSCGGALLGAGQFRTGPVFENCNLVAHFVPSNAPQVALSVSIDDARGRVAPGDAVEYALVVRNDSDIAVEGIALATTATPAGALLDPAWQCSVPAPGACTPAQGAGQIAATLSIPAHAQVQLTLGADVGDFAESVAVTATITVPEDYLDTDASDDTATDTDFDARPEVFGDGFEE